MPCIYIYIAYALDNFDGHDYDVRLLGEWSTYKEALAKCNCDKLNLAVTRRATESNWDDNGDYNDNGMWRNWFIERVELTLVGIDF